MGIVNPQLLQVYSDIEPALLERVEDVVLCRVYIPDVAAWDTVNAVYAAFFGSHKPARVIVPTRELHNGARIEIEAIAEVR